MMRMMIRMIRPPIPRYISLSFIQPLAIQTFVSSAGLLGSAQVALPTLRLTGNAAETTGRLA
jgi:hypothetical protein